MRNPIVFAAVVALAAVAYAGTAQRGRPRYQPSPSAVSSTAATPVSSCTGDSVSYDNNGVAGCQRTTDTAPQGVMVRAQPAFPGGTQTASKVVLCGGQDETTYTVADYTQCGTDTMTVTVVDSNGTSTANALVEATDFTAATSNAVTATNLAAAIDALSGVSASASSATVRISLDPNTCIVTTASSDTNCATTSTGTAGVVESQRRISIPMGDATTPGLFFNGDSNTGIYSSTADRIDTLVGGALRFTVTSSGPSTASTFTSQSGSGGNGFAISTNGARVDFGAGASDYASSDGTTVTFAGPIKISGTPTVNTCTLDGASPSVCTATVTASSTCTCSNVGATAAIAANGCAVSLSGTTLTVTSANGATNVVNIHCF